MFVRKSTIEYVLDCLPDCVSEPETHRHALALTQNQVSHPQCKRAPDLLAFVVTGTVRVFR